MNDLVNKIKTYDYKGFALKHGEKVGLSVVILFTVLALYKTTWGTYDKTPAELVDQAKKAMNTLTTRGWPEEDKKKFEFVDLEERSKKQVAAMQTDKFKYSQVFTHPLYNRMPPADRPKMLTVLYPRVNKGDFPVETRATVTPGTGAPGAEQPGSPDSAPAAAPADDFNPELSGPSRPIAAAPAAKAAPGALVPMDMGPEDNSALHERLRAMRRMRDDEGSAPAAGKKARDEKKPAGKTVARIPQRLIQGRGLRYVSYRAVFPWEQQAQLIREALHHSTLSRAVDDLEINNFEIQRQRLVKSDPETWGEWETLDYDTAASILEEAANYAADVVLTAVTNNVITMPLPERLRGVWHWTTVGHDVLEQYLLKTKEQQELEQKKNEAIVEAANKLKVNETKKKRKPGELAKRGFAGSVRDMRALSQNLNERMMAMGDGDDDYGAMAMMRRRMMMNSNSAMAPNPNNPGNPGLRRTGPNPRGLAAFTGSDPFAIPKYMLFRYLDFTVEPGECYRYRVRLEFLNPNYQKALDKVVSADVAQGETLKSDWSEPSPPIYVEPDLDVYLVHVPRNQKTIGEGATLSIIEWDPRFGTNVTADLKHYFGQIIGGVTTTKVLDPFSRSLAERPLAIRTRDVFVDSKTLPPMFIVDNPDLGVSKEQWKALETSGAFEHAVTVNTSADLVEHLPPAERDRYAKAMKDTDKERSYYKDWEAKEEAEAKPTGDALDIGMAAGKGKPGAKTAKPGAQKAAASPLRPESGAQGARGGARGRGGRGGAPGSNPPRAGGYR